MLHELLHNELMQNGENPKHDGRPWARRCQELSDLLGITVHIEHARKRRFPGRNPTMGCPDGCLPYDRLTCWPHGLLADGPPLRVRAEMLPVGYSYNLHLGDKAA